MPYFPKYATPAPQAYYCRNCKVWYLPPSYDEPQVSCCVLHPPGSCCHMGETKIEATASVAST